MDMEEIRYLLGGTVFARAKAYTDRIQDLNCEVAGNGVRHLSADVRGGGRSLYQTQVWLRENGTLKCPIVVEDCGMDEETRQTARLASRRWDCVRLGWDGEEWTNAKNKTSSQAGS